MMHPIDYETIMDGQTRAFIDASAAAYPPETASLSIAQQRAIYDRMCRSFHRGYPAEVTALDQLIAGVPCRVFDGGQPAVVYLHGGGFVVGGLESHDDICAEIRARTGLRVVLVDYRLSPENPHPAAFDDCIRRRAVPFCWLAIAPEAIWPPRCRMRCAPVPSESRVRS
jgi:acetyl esterase